MDDSTHCHGIATHRTSGGTTTTTNVVVVVIVVTLRGCLCHVLATVVTALFYVTHFFFYYNNNHHKVATPIIPIVYRGRLDGAKCIRHRSNRTVGMATNAAGTPDHIVGNTGFGMVCR